MQKDRNRQFNWAGLPLIATIVRLLCRELTLQNEYLRLENKQVLSAGGVTGGHRLRNDGYGKAVVCSHLLAPPSAPQDSTK